MSLAIHLVYGRAYVGSIAPARWLAAAFFLRGMGKMLTAGVRGLGLPNLSIPADGVALAVSMLSLVIFITRWGLDGAAWAVGLTSCVSIIYLLYLGKYNAGLRFGRILILPGFD
jgi:O-antigen/teichoic acid export membrane protein